MASGTGQGDCLLASIEMTQLKQLGDLTCATAMGMTQSSRSLPNHPARTAWRRGTVDQSANRQAMQAAAMVRPEQALPVYGCSLSNWHCFKLVDIGAGLEGTRGP